MECCGRAVEDGRRVETGVAGRVAGAGEHWPDSCGQKGGGGCSDGALLQRGAASSSESALALRRLREDGGGRGEAVGAGGCRGGKLEQLEQLDLLAATAQMLLED